jgi:predicted nucleic acid-binding protein
LVRDEPESPALRAFLDDANDPGLPLQRLLARAGELLEALAMLPLDDAILLAAGALQEPVLRALDAIHVTAALALSPLDAFVSYDERQCAAALLAGLRTVTPSDPGAGSGGQD